MALDPEMLTRPFYFLLFILHCPPSLLHPLAQQNVGTTSNANSSVESRNIITETNQFESITPDNLKFTEIIQQIDVKDNQNQVISNINLVVISDEPNVSLTNTNTEKNQNNSLTPNNETQYYVPSKVLSNNTSVPIENATFTLGDVEITSFLNSKSLTNNANTAPILQTNNFTVSGLQNDFASEKQTDAYNTTNVVARNTTNSRIAEVIYENNSSLVSNNTNNDNQFNSKKDFLDHDGANLLEEKDISSSETPVFRSISHKKTNSLQVQNISTEKPNISEDNNLFKIRLPESRLIEFDINQIPVNNLFGIAIDLIKRFKRNADVDTKSSNTWKNNCNSTKIDNEHIL